MRLLSVGFLLWSAALFAQLAPLGPQAAYNGQNVSAISLIANPHRDLKPLLPLVAQKPGTPYSQATIEATAQALKQAGGFPRVDVSVEPEVAGLTSQLSAGTRLLSWHRGLSRRRKVLRLHPAPASRKSS